VWRYLSDPTFSRFDTIPECDRHTERHTDRHTTTAYTALSMASRGKNETTIVCGSLHHYLTLCTVVKPYLHCKVVKIAIQIGRMCKVSMP